MAQNHFLKFRVHIGALRASALQQPVGQGRFAVIDVRDDAKIARQLNSHESATIRARLRVVN